MHIFFVWLHPMIQPSTYRGWSVGVWALRSMFLCKNSPPAHSCNSIRTLRVYSNGKRHRADTNLQFSLAEGQQHSMWLYSGRLFYFSQCQYKHGLYFYTVYSTEVHWTVLLSNKQLIKNGHATKHGHITRVASDICILIVYDMEWNAVKAVLLC